MFSYWEQQSFTEYDHIVIGAGITGLSTAIELKALYPDEKVLVLERGLISSGASTRNAGFACMGSVTELLGDLKTMPEEEVVALFAARKKGLEILRTRLGDGKIGYAKNGSYELIGDNAKEALKHIDYLNELLLEVNIGASFRLVNEKIDGFGFSKNHCTSLIENICEGELHTGKMMSALEGYAIKSGVQIKTGVRVTGYEEDSKMVTVFVCDPVTSDKVQLRCKTLSLCTNAFTGDLLAGEDVVPGRGQVLVTKPIAGLKFKGVFHFDEGYYYFREIDGRVLLGGGRNIDFEGEQTDSAAITHKIQDALEAKLRDVIIPDVPFEVEYRWAGTMAFGKTKEPIIQAFSNRVFGAFRMGGMGVALGSEAARQLAVLHKDKMAE